jgi:hypothetical protein
MKLKINGKKKNLMFYILIKKSDVLNINILFLINIII